MIIMLVIWCSAFNIAAVTVPPEPKPAACTPENVTKSLAKAPWAVSVTVITLLPFVAANLTSPALVVERTGVMSL